MEKGYKKTIMTKDKFIFHKEWRNSIRDLPDDIRVAVYDAIVEYGLSGIIIDGMDTAVKLAFGFIKERIDKDNEKYEAICARNRANGSKSKGRPPKTQKNPVGFENNPNNPVGFLGFSGFSEKESSPIPPKEKKDSSHSSESKGEKESSLRSDSKKTTLEERQNVFYNSLIPFMGKYPSDMLREFYDYWSEPNKSRTKMRFEQQPTWELSRRLARWNNNNSSKQYNNHEINRRDYEAEQRRTDIELRIARLAAEDDAKRSGTNHP